MSTPNLGRHIGGSKGPGAPKRPLTSQIPEALLARLWQERAARQATFRTSQGKRIHVLYPGRWSSEAGPDFRDALLYQEDLGLVRGDVELHLRQEGWRNHGHGTDPRYNGVVLHGVLQGCGTPTQLSSGAEAPVVWLESLLHPSKPARPDNGRKRSLLWSLLRRSGFNPPQRRSHGQELLNQAGEARFLSKSRIYAILQGEDEPQEVLYQGVMECMGYSENRHPFLQLAHMVPYRTLEGLANATAPEEQHALLGQRLLNASGLLQDGEGGKGGSMKAPVWNLYRVRPSNHPRRRIAGVAHLLRRYMEHGLLQGLTTLVRLGSWRAVETGLIVPGPGQGPALIGKSRAGDMAVNVLLPYLHAWATLGEDSGLSETVLSVYKSYPRLQTNRLTQEMERCLFPREWTPLATTAQHQQGLIQLHHMLAGGG